MRASLIGLSVIVLSVIGFLIWHYAPATEESPESDVVKSVPDDLATDRVLLTTESAARNPIDIDQAVTRLMEPVRVIPGRLDYDQTKHVMIRSAAAGVVTQYHVMPGDRVQAGQVVAVVSCPEVGTIRSEISQRQADLEIARKREQWTVEIRQGVTQLVDQIRSTSSADQMESSLKGLALGDYRERLVTAYTRLRLASQLEGNTRSAAARGAVSGKVQTERESELQAAEAALASVVEQSLFDVQQNAMQEQAATAKAERDLRISREKLKLLLGPAASPNDLVSAGDLSGDSLALVNLVSPIDGTAEQRMVAPYERVDAGQPVLLVADLDHLWAVADIRENDWQVASVDVGAPVTLTTPVIPGESFPARVLVVGPSVDPMTQVMPLVARIDRADQRLKPGLFIRMEVHLGTSHSALTVPDSAVARHENETFVFVPDGELAYRRKDVRVGETINGWTEILDGLREGEQIVVAGVFKLQSALLLAGEEE
jgi:cobalt-zinc-cadmium efflux system membrane fusion protein